MSSIAYKVREYRAVPEAWYSSVAALLNGHCQCTTAKNMNPLRYDI